MSTNAYFSPQFISTALSTVGGIDDSQTTGIKISSVSGVEIAKPGILCLSYTNPIVTDNAEWITYTSIDGTNELQGVTRGAEGFSAKAHSNGVTIAFPLSKSHINNLNTALIIGGVATNMSEGVLDEDTFATDSATKLATQQSIKAYVDASAGTSQAIINGNFDVWQRGTSIAMTTADAYAADRWYCETATAATDKTVSRQTASNNGSYYSARVAMVQDTDELLTFSQALESQDSIKFRGQKLTLSFWAKAGAEFVTDNSTLVCKIVTGKGTDQKVLAFTTSADAISANKTLTDTFVKHTITTTAAIASDITQIGVSFAFTHAGAGVTTNYFEVSQVQLCAGSVASPFMSKSFATESADCKRYYEKSFSYATTPAQSVISTQYAGGALNTGIIETAISFKVAKRIIPTVTFYQPADGSTSGMWSYQDNGSWVDATTMTAVDANTNTFTARINGSGFTVYRYHSMSGHWTADAEL